MSIGSIISEAAKAQVAWEKKTVYKWEKQPTIMKSQTYGTCVTYVACVLQRVGVLEPGQFVWTNGTGFGDGKVIGANSRMTVTYYKNNKTIKDIKSLLQVGDILIFNDNKSGKAGSCGHICFYNGGTYSNGIHTFTGGHIISANGKEKYSRKVFAHIRIKSLPTRKTIDQLAHEVLAGKWGSGNTRKIKIINAGYDYDKVQARVNELLQPYQNLDAKNYVSSTVKIGQATSDEKGGLSGGIAGDQTKKEVAIANWSYTSGDNYNTWKYVFRAKDSKARLKIAQAAIDVCNNDHIGYDTNSPDRKSCFKAAEKVNFNLSNITTNCELTCSELVNVCIAAAGLKSYLSISQPAYVVTLTNKLNASNEFTKYTSSNYTSQSKNLLPGDIIISGSHAAIVIKAPSQTTGEDMTAKKDVTTIANEVIAGKWGSGDARKQKLKAAGYDYDTVQKKVNEILASKKKSVDIIAQEVIDGKWGSGDTRKKKLTDAGYNYDAVQKKVNELLAKKAPVKKAYSGQLPTTAIKKTNTEVINDTVRWALWIAGDNNFHYGYTNAAKGANAHHNGCYFCKTQRMKKNMLMPEHTYCCNPFVGAAWAHGGCVPKALSLCRNTNSWDFHKNSGYAKSSLFTNLGHPAKSSLKKGDVLCRDTHVALYIGNGKIVEAGSGDDNVKYSSKWNNSIRVKTLTDANYKNFPRVHRFNSSVNTVMTISHGEVSNRVALWQAFLDWYFDGKVGKADGIYGDNTLKWTKAFQEKEVGKGQGDGFIGPKTLAAAAAVKK